VNGSVRWLLPGARERLSVGLEAFNLTSRRHYQILPTKSKDDFGQSGERIGRRLTATISCQW
jgi:hypothetical protein